MVRTWIRLTDRQHGELQRWARGLGISPAEAVRRCIEERLEIERRRADRVRLAREARAVFGKYADPAGESQVAVDHDEHLADSALR